jgi:hypothetical protein
MKHIGWLEAGREALCINCRVEGRSGMMVPSFAKPPEASCRACTKPLTPEAKFCPECGTKVSHEKPPIIVEFVCNDAACGQKRGPYIVDSEDAAPTNGDGTAAASDTPVAPTPEEVAKFSAKPSERKSRIAPAKPSDPIDQQDLIALCKEKFPAMEILEGNEFPLRVVPVNVMNGDANIQGVKVCYGQAGPNRASAQANVVIRLDVIEEILWCEEGEPTVERIEATLKALENSIKNAVRGVPQEIHKVVHRPTGPAERRICGECHQPVPCMCANQPKLLAANQGAGLAKGAEAPPPLDNSFRRVYS